MQDDNIVILVCILPAIADIYCFHLIYLYFACYLYSKKSNSNSKGGASTGNLFADLRSAAPKNISDDQIKKLMDTHSGNKNEIERALENLWLDNQVEAEFQIVNPKSKKTQQNQNESSSAPQSSERKGKSIDKAGAKGPNNRGERPANTKREDKRSNTTPAAATMSTAAPTDNKVSTANEQPKATNANTSAAAPASKGDAWGAKSSSDQLSFADMLKKQESEEKKKAAAAAAAAAAATTAVSNGKQSSATSSEDVAAKGKVKKDRVKKERETKPRKNAENSASSSSQDVTAGTQILSFAEASAVVERPSVAPASTSRSTLPAAQSQESSISSAPIKPVTLPTSITSLEDKREQLDFQFGNFPSQLGSSSTATAAPAWNIGQDSSDSSHHTTDWSNSDLSNSSNAIFQNSVGGMSTANSRPFDSKMTPPPGLDVSQGKQQSQQRQVGQPRKNDGNQQHNNFPRGAVPTIPTPYGYGQPFENPAAYMPMPPYTAGLNSTTPQASTGVTGNTAPTGANAQQAMYAQTMAQQQMMYNMQYQYPYNPYMYPPRSNSNYMYGNAFNGGYDQSNQFSDSTYNQHSMSSNTGASGSNNPKQNKGTTVSGQPNEYINHPNMPGYFQNNDRFNPQQAYAYGGYPMMYGQPNANNGGNAFGQSNQGSGGRGSNNNYGNNNAQFNGRSF